MAQAEIYTSFNTGLSAVSPLRVAEMYVSFNTELAFISGVAIIG